MNFLFGKPDDPPTLGYLTDSRSSAAKRVRPAPPQVQAVLASIAQRTHDFLPRVHPFDMGFRV